MQLKWGIVTALDMFLGTLLFMLLPSQLLGIFSATQEMLDIGVPAFRVILSVLFSRRG